MCALLDPDKARAALLEAKLLADPGATWVERAGVDAVLREQQVQAMFGPAGVGDRVRLGQLLKADVLVMVRPVQGGKDPALEVIVSETAGGLRLAVHGVPVTDKPDADVASLAAVVAAGVAKSRVPIKEVVAVPPFVSHDLGFEFDHLKAAYARLAEAEVMSRPGVLAVEFDEARALAREVSVAAPGSKLDRPLPVYLLGEYRHETTGTGRAVRLTLRAELGGKSVGRPVALTTPPAEAPRAIRRWAAGVLEGVGGKAHAPADPVAEVRLLADRARTFERLANWSEASGLIEAALLLDTDNPDLLAAAVPPLTKMAQQVGPVFPTPETAQRLWSIQALGLHHLGALIARDEDLRSYTDRNGGQLSAVHLAAGRRFSPYSVRANWPRKELLELRDAQREAVVALIPRLARGAPKAERVYVMDALMYLPTAERYALVEKLILQLRDLPGHKDRTLSYLQTAWLKRVHYQSLAKPGEEAAALHTLLTRLVTSENADIRSAAEDAARMLAQELQPGVPERPPEPEGIRLRPLGPVLEADGRVIDRLDGIRPISAGVDVAWGPEGLYVMKAKGKLRPVWTTNEQLFRFHTVCFDGRYVWASTQHYQKWAFLVVLDPATERVWLVTGADGLPQGTEEQRTRSQSRFLDVAPLGPGRACVAGSFGRTWVAVVTFDPAAGKAAVRVIHEAREAQKAGDESQWARTTVDFEPDYMFTLTGKADTGRPTEQRVIVGRRRPYDVDGSENHEVAAHPLVVDPDRPAVEVLKTPFRKRMAFGTKAQLVATDDAVYAVENGQFTSPPRNHNPLVRVKMPGPDVEMLPASGPSVIPAAGAGPAVVYAGRLHYVWTWCEPLSGPPSLGITKRRIIHDLWSVGPDGTGGRKLGSNLPHIHSLYTSSHYGLVAAQGPTYGYLRLYQVQFPDPLTK